MPDRAGVSSGINFLRLFFAAKLAHRPSTPHLRGTGPSPSWPLRLCNVYFFNRTLLFILAFNLLQFDKTPVCELSIVIPFLNEERTLPELLRLLSEQRALPDRRELIFVSDGSTDRSVEIILESIKHDPRIKLLKLSRNFGHQAAVTAGLDYARGEFISIMDADLQDEPHVLVAMLEQARREGWDVVYAVRGSRKGSLLKRFCYSLFYRLYSLLSETPVNMDSGDFCVMSRRCLNCLLQLPEQSRFHRGLRSWVGLRQIGYRVERPERFAGDPQYTWKGLMQLGVTGLTSFSIRPLRIASLLGCCLCLLSVIAALSYVAYALVNDVPSYVPGFTTLVCLLLLLNGALMVQLGIIGEYLGRLFMEVKRRPSYLIESRFNIESLESSMETPGLQSNGLASRDSLPSSRAIEPVEFVPQVTPPAAN